MEIVLFFWVGPSILFQEMEQKYRHREQFYFKQNQYRSTSDLLPKCRSEALKAKRAAARSKINLIAKQLYELKYDHEWEEQQLERLVAKGECITSKVDDRMRQVQGEVEQLAAHGQIEGLSLDVVREKEESTLASERSTQPERDDETAESQKTQIQPFETNGSLTVIPTCNPMTQSLHIPFTKSDNMLASTRMKSSLSARQLPTKKATNQFIRQIPLGNIILCVFLLVVVLVLL